MVGENENGLQWWSVVAGLALLQSVALCYFVKLRDWLVICCSVLALANYCAIMKSDSAVVAGSMDGDSAITY